MAATAKDCHTLINYYLKEYEKKKGLKPPVNRNTARWSFANILEDFTVSEVKELIDYYMHINASHNNSLPWFFNHYEQLAVSKEERDADIVARRKLREETKRRTEEWRKKNIVNGRNETD